MAIDRRTLLRRSCLTAASFAAAPRWAAAGLFRQRGAALPLAAASDTILVVVQMGGGNDGLNTVVPFGDPTYRAARTRLALTGSQTLPIDVKTGLHPSLSYLHGYLNSGKLAIIQGVGYPGPDMSHFRSDDIWESAVPDAVEPTGWLGRALDQLYRQDADNLHGLSFTGNTLAFHNDFVTIPAVTDLAQFTYPHDDPAQTAALQADLEQAGSTNRAYVSHIGQLAIANSAAIQAALPNYASTVVYPTDSRFAESLRQIAAVLFADLGPRIFFVNQGEGSYDTHNSQLGEHERLLSDLDQGLDAFYRDLEEHGYGERVVVMTYSEFGRRVEDNGSGGTDHGAAGPMFVLGARVRGGLFGAPPSLTDLDRDGNLKYTVDFRRVYASILANWIKADPVAVLRGDYPTLSFL